MSLRFFPRSLASLLLSLLLSLGMASCGDNIGCVFTTGCSSSSGAGGIGGSGMPATAPSSGQFISNALPEVQAIFPRGSNVGASAPIVIVFNEAMSVDSLDQAFELIPVIGNNDQLAVALGNSVLVADGRVLLLFPELPVLLPGAYSLRISNEAGASIASDLTGQVMDAGAGSRLGDLFTVSATASEVPSLIMTWPLQGDTSISDMSEVLAVFDLPISPLSFNTDSFVVLIDGAEPALNPDPEALSYVDQDDLSQTDPRIFTWRSESSTLQGIFSPGADFELTLSPSTAPILSAANMAEQVAVDVITGTVIPFGTPSMASLLSAPNDGLGIRNLTSGNTEEFLLQVSLDGAQANDLVDVFLFGDNTADPVNRQMIALRRQKVLTGAGVIGSVSFSLDEIDLLQSSSPTDPRFSDGTLAIAVSLRRGGVSSPLHVLDTDLGTSGIQDVVLDVTAPTITSFDFAPDMTLGEPISNLRDATITGVASEALRSVEVVLTQGMATLNNGVQPPVVASSSNGGFIAAPVIMAAEGIVPGGTASYTLVAYDRVFNASVQTFGTFTQVGAVGAGPFLNNQDVTVHVFDAQRLIPLPNVNVVLHSDMGNGTYPFHMEGLTDAFGNLTLSPSDAPVGRLLTLELEDYNLLTFHGLTSNTLSIPLDPQGTVSQSVVSGIITSDDPGVAAILPSQSIRLDDSRRLRQLPSAFEISPCLDGGGVLNCAMWVGMRLHPGRQGAASLLAGNFGLSDASFSASALLRSFCLSVPTGFSPPEAASFLSYDIPFLLELADASEQPLELSAFEFRADGITGLDFGQLNVDPDTTGDPRASVETIIPGVPGSVAVGLGLAFDDGMLANRWNVRSAVPGAVTAGGFFGLTQTVDTDFFLRCELRDDLGNVSGARVRLSRLATQAPVANALIAGNIPQLLSPLINTGGASFDLTFAETIMAASNEAGLYSVALQDGSLRRWTLWTPDGATDGVRTVHVPDLSMSAAVPLSNGIIVFELSSFSWEDLDFDQGFLWSSIEREHDQFAQSAPRVLLQP